MAKQRERDRARTLLPQFVYAACLTPGVAEHQNVAHATTVRPLCASAQYNGTQASCMNLLDERQPRKTVQLHVMLAVVSVSGWRAARGICAQRNIDQLQAEIHVCGALRDAT